MRKTLLPVFGLLFTGLSFAQTPYELHFDNVTQVSQHDLEYVGNDRIHAGTAVTDQQQTIVWFAKTSAANELLWMKSFQVTVNNNNPFCWVDIENCNLSDNIMLSVTRSGTSSSQIFTELLKLSTDGEVVWGRRATFDDDSFNVYYSNKMVVLSNDAVIVSNGHTNGISLCKVSAQGLRLASHHLSIAEEVTEEPHNGGCVLTAAENGGFLASFQKDNHPVLVKLDDQFNALWTKEWSSQEHFRITAIREFDSDIFFGGTTSGPDFFGYISSDLGSTSFAEFTDAGFFEIDVDRFSSMPGKLFAYSYHGYRLIDYAAQSYTAHSISTGLSDLGLHYQLRGGDQKATCFVNQSGEFSVAYIEEMDLTAPQCVEDLSHAYPIVPITIPPNTVLAPTVYKQDFGSFTSYSPDIAIRSASIAESCFYVGTEENTLPVFDIYPNPVASGQMLHIESTGIESGVITLTDLQGKIVAEFAYAPEITLPALNAGVYFVTVSEQNGQRSSTQRIVVQ